MLRRRLIVITVSAIWGGLLGAVPAAAGELPEYPTFIQGESATVVLTTSGDEIYKKFGGEIGSPLGDCVPDRNVALYRRRHGDRKKLGSDTTDGAGKWKIKVSSRNGKYFYKVKQKVITPAETGEAVVCLGVKSDKLD